MASAHAAAGRSPVADLAGSQVLALARAIRPDVIVGATIISAGKVCARPATGALMVLK